MPVYEQLQTRLAQEPHTWLVAGVAGFIGSNLLETLLKLEQRVVGLDNFANGYQRNLDEVRTLVSPAQWANFQFIEGDIRKLEDCRRACAGVDDISPLPARGEREKTPSPACAGEGAPRRSNYEADWLPLDLATATLKHIQHRRREFIP
jgi:hypothetical protein